MADDPYRPGYTVEYVEYGDWEQDDRRMRATVIEVIEHEALGPVRVWRVKEMESWTEK